MPLKFVHNDIVDMYVDAIVNTANPKPVIGYGLDERLHKNAGHRLIEERKTIGDIEVGEAAITSGGNLNAKYVIHTVSPWWRGGDYDEENLLASCYRNSLKLASENNCETIAFPLLATGNMGLPKSLALEIAIKECASFLEQSDMLINLVVFDEKSFEIPKEISDLLNDYIDNNCDEYRIPLTTDNDIQCIYCEKDLEITFDWAELDAGFAETLLKLIDEKGVKASRIYNKANITRQHFYKIRKNLKYRPSKETAVAFAIALELDLDETENLLNRAGYALSNSLKFDRIIVACIESKLYDINTVNAILYKYDQPLLGYFE